MSFIKMVFSKSDGFILKLLDAEVAKPFSFALLLKNPKIKDEKIIPEGNKAKFVFSTSDVDFAIKFYNGFMQIWRETNRKIKIGIFSPMEIEPFGFQINVKKTKSSQIVLKTLSPICLKTKDGIPVLPSSSEPQKQAGEKYDESDEKKENSKSHVIYDDDEFRKSLTYSIEILSPEKAKKVNFIKFEGKKVVVKHFPSEESKESGNPVKLICWSGEIYAEGDPETLNFVYLTGIGFRRNQGFGCLDILKEIK